MPTKKPSFKDYKIDEKSPVIALTMEATGVSREEAIKVIKELSYRVDYPKKKKKHAA
jgi:NACalpha-BTF3-like transcription factor